MKKKVFLVTLLALLAVGCNGVTPESSTPVQSEETISISGSSEAPQKYNVVLPNINGVEVTVDELQKEAGAKVRLLVKNNLPSSRVESVTVNGVVLGSVDTEDPSCKAYDFFMPSGQDAVVEVDLVDVYLVSVATKASSILSLSGIGDGLFKEGEEVTFVPTTFAGYWYNEISLVNADVDLIDNNDGSYSFTMPAHAVTVTAQTGTNYYMVTYNTFSAPYEVSFASGDSFAFGEVVDFTVTPTQPDVRITSVIVDGELLSLESDGYKFVMPAYPVTLEVEYSNVFKSFEVLNSTHFDATLKTVVAGNEVEVGNENVVSNQKVFIEVSDNLTEQDHNQVVDTVQVYGGETLQTATTLLDGVVKEGERYSFTTLPEYLCYKVVVLEKEAPDELVGEFKGVALSNAYSMNTLSFGEGGVLTRNSYASTITQTSPNYEYTTEMWGSIYGYKAFVSPNKDAVLEYNMGYSYNGTEYPTSNNYRYSSLSFFVESDLCASSNTEVNAFSIITCDDAWIPSEFYSELVAFTKLDGTMVTCFYVFETSTVYWDVTFEVTGVDGKTRGDVVKVFSSEGEELTTMTLSDKGSTGYQYRATI